MLILCSKLMSLFCISFSHDRSKVRICFQISITQTLNNIYLSIDITYLSRKTSLLYTMKQQILLNCLHKTGMRLRFFASSLFFLHPQIKQARRKMKNKFDFQPKLFTALRNYSKERFMTDLMAGIIVGIVAPTTRHRLVSPPG